MGVLQVHSAVTADGHGSKCIAVLVPQCIRVYSLYHQVTYTNLPNGRGSHLLLFLQVAGLDGRAVQVPLGPGPVQPGSKTTLHTNTVLRSCGLCFLGGRAPCRWQGWMGKL